MSDSELRQRRVDHSRHANSKPTEVVGVGMYDRFGDQWAKPPPS
jgi:hypothetical protein